MSKRDEFEHDLIAVLNRHSMENESNTPDFILARYLLACLDAWNEAAHERETWYGHFEWPGSQWHP